MILLSRIKFLKMFFHNVNFNNIKFENVIIENSDLRMIEINSSNF